MNCGSENGNKTADAKDIMDDKFTEFDWAKRKGICKNYFEVMALENSDTYYNQNEKFKKEVNLLKFPEKELCMFHLQHINYSWTGNLLFCFRLHLVTAHTLFFCEILLLHSQLTPLPASGWASSLKKENIALSWIQWLIQRHTRPSWKKNYKTRFAIIVGGRNKCFWYFHFLEKTLVSSAVSVI